MPLTLARALQLERTRTKPIRTRLESGALPTPLVRSLFCGCSASRAAALRLVSVRHRRATADRVASMPKNVLILSLSFVSWAVCMMSLVAEVMRAIQEANGIRARQVAFARGVLDTYDANFVVWCVHASNSVADHAVPTSCRGPTCRISLRLVRAPAWPWLTHQTA